MPGSAYPIIMNVVLIASSFVTIFIPAYSLSYGVILSGILQLIFLVGMSKYYKVPVGFPDFNSNFFNYDVKHFFRKLLPSIMTSCVTRIGITIDTMIASSSIGAVSYIYYADRLYQLPLAIIGVAMATVLLPCLSKITAKINHHKESENHDEHQRLVERLKIIQSRVFEFALILILPATLGLFFLANDISAVIFGANNGKFGLNGIEETGNFLKILCLALPANILNSVFNSILFSNHITKFTTKASVWTLAVNLSINFLLYYKYDFGFKSVAVATVVSSYFNVLCLAIFCKKKGFISPSNDISRIRYIIFTNMFLCVAIEALNLAKDSLFIKFSWQWDVFLLLQIGIIINLYFIILSYRGKFKLSDFKGLFID
jgi:putative peptidoglycan lipid II flippase